jgi:transposase InsO family protein
MDSRAATRALNGSREGLPARTGSCNCRQRRQWLAGWDSEQQRQVIEYLTTENTVLREKLGGGRILLNDDQRRRLAVKGKVLGRKRLSEIRTLFTPDAIFYLLFVMELKTRRVKFVGCTTNPNEAWMKTISLELTNHKDGFLKDKKYLIMDRDATFSQSFRACLRREGVKPVRLSPRSPNLNAHPKRFFGSLKSECLHKLILFGETATRKAVRAFVVHYHTERNHQGLGNELIVPMNRPPDIDAEIETTERIGGLLRSYRRAA